MPLDSPSSSQHETVDNVQANNHESVENTLGSPIDLEDRNSAAMIIDDDEPDNPASTHHPVRPHEIIDVDEYDSDVEELDVAPVTSLEERQARIKAENSTPIKIEIEDDYFDWTPMGVRDIDLTEGIPVEDSQASPGNANLGGSFETGILDDDFEWALTGGQAADMVEIAPIEDPQASIMNANLGQPILGNRTRTAPLPREMMLEAQRRMASRMLNRPVPTGASSIFGGGTTSFPSFANINADAIAVSNYQQAKIVYRRKKHLGQLTIEDEVIWGKAKADEKRRLENSEQGASVRTGIDISIDEAAESDDGLFITQRTPRKRGHEEIIDDSEDDEAHGASAPRDVVDILGSEGEANRQMKKKAPSKRKTANDRAREVDDARMVGLEELLASENRKMGKKGRKSKPRKRRGNNNDPNGRSTDRSRQGPLGNVLNTASFLGSSNIYDEANRNVNAAPGPIVSTRRKDQAFKDMLIDIPLGDLRQARGDRHHILESSRVLGKYGLCRLANDGTNNWVLKGMSSTLYHYQVLGSAWMKLRETGDVAPYGGILADQMGLGKTLQILACMVANRPEPTDDIQATLIVCTASIAHQWEQEIQKHTQPDVFRTIIRYSAGSRIRGVAGVDMILQRSDVVVTTYDEVRRSYPKFKPPKHIVLPEKKRAWWDENYKDLRGILHRVHWHRVVLDEAQAIKNRDSQTSIACRSLMAKCRWAVTATPIQNAVEEMYPYFQLLRVKHTGDWQTFWENFCNPKDPDCTPRLHALLKQFMMRRTHADTVMGRPLIILPENHQRTITIELNVVERAMYDMVQRRFVLAINQCGRDGNLEKRYRSVLHMLLRLRQMTGHPFMLQDIVENLFEVEDIEKLLALEVSADTAPDDPSRSMLNVMKTMIRAKTNPGSAEGIFSDTTPSEISYIEDDFSSPADMAEPLIFEFRQFLQGLVQGQKWAEMKARSLCHKCGDVPEIPHVTDCYHLYCMECLRAIQEQAAIEGQEHAECYECGKRFLEARSCSGIAELEIDQPVSQATGRGILGAIAPKRNTDKETLQWINYGGEVLPSTKTAAVVAQVEDWQRADPNKKIIVFSQFHTLMNVLAKLFAKKEWNFVKFNGRMSQAERGKALADFENNADCKIMIASLKAGGVGLNLTMASKVINVDLWWNSSVEQQAFCRVFRIGQPDETYITRFVARNTVDDKLQQMQERKAAAVGHAIDDETMLRELSLRELLGLFGQVGEEDGREGGEEGEGEGEGGRRNPFIVVDDEGEYDGVGERPLRL
ncbi:MAG: hypothetical protein Q9169_007960 [Polycauliona sp. 2 TL-2023]